jgi:hypothetical protein
VMAELVPSFSVRISIWSIDEAASTQNVNKHPHHKTSKPRACHRAQHWRRLC